MLVYAVSHSPSHHPAAGTGSRHVFAWQTLNIATGAQNLVAGQGLAIARFHASSEAKVWAYVEKGNMPSIYLHRYPSHDHFQTLRGATELELLDLQFSRDGTVLLSLGSRPDFSLVLWDWRAGVPLLRSRFTYSCSTLVMHPSDPLAFAAVGPTALVFGKFDRELEHYFLNMVQAVPQVDGQEPEYSHCCWAQDPKYVHVVVARSHLATIDSVSGETLTGPSALFEDADSGIEVSCLTLAGKHLVVGADDGNLHWVNIEEEAVCYSVEVPDTPRWLVWTPGGGRTLLYIGSLNSTLLKLSLTAQVPLHPLGEEDEKVPVHELVQLADYHAAEVTAVALLPSNRIVSCSADMTLRTWDMDRLVSLAKLCFHEPLCCLAVHPTISLVCVGSSGGWVLVVDLEDASEPQVLLQTHLCNAAVLRVAFDSGGTNIAVTVADSHRVFILNGSASAYEVLGFVDLRSKALPNPRPKAAMFAHVGAKEQLAVLVEPTTLVVFSLGAKGDGPRIKADYSSGGGVCLLTAVAFDEGEVASASMVTDVVFLPQAHDGNAAVVLAVNTDKTVWKFGLPSLLSPPDHTDASSIANAEQMAAEVVFDKKGLAGIVLAPNNEWLVAGGPDGAISIRLVSSLSTVLVHRQQYDAWLVNDRRIPLCVSADSRWIISADASGSIGVWATEPPARIPLRPLPPLAQAVLSVDVDGSEPTYLQSVQGEQAEVANAVHTAMQNMTRARLKQLSADLQARLDENMVAPEIERLQRLDFVVDIELRNQLYAQAEQRVEQERESKRVENLSHELIWKRVKEEVWDKLMVHGLSVCAMQSALEVFNYPMCQTSTKGQSELAVCKAMREHESAEQAARDEAKGSAGSGLGEAVEVAEEDEPESDAKALRGAAGGGLARLGWFADLGRADGKKTGATYHPFEVHTEERKRTQARLLLAVVDELKLGFNAEIDAALKRKQELLDRIGEKQQRITEVLDELRQKPDTLLPTKLGVTEVAGSVLRVLDEEVTVEKVLSEAERKALEEDREARDARERNRTDDSCERALQVMMDGRLETSDGKMRLDVELEKPEWMRHAPPEEGWSKEQQQEIDDFEKRAAELAQEQEKQRKALETELKKLRAEIEAMCKDFDESLQTLFNKRMEVGQSLFPLTFVHSR
jgi:WD40 repeat protein